MVDVISDEVYETFNSQERMRFAARTFALQTMISVKSEMQSVIFMFYNEK